MIERLTIFETPLQEIELEDISCFERILDIGAGGEGLTARIGKEQVFGVDINVDEIKEVRNKGIVSNWTVCDARNLCFKDGIFDLVTIWFSLMYIKETEDKIQVLSECRRVLAKDGTMHLMDASISTQKEVFILNAKFKLPDGQLMETGYGVSGSQKQSSSWAKKELMKLGFKITRENAKEHWFNLVCRIDLLI